MAAAKAWGMRPSVWMLMPPWEQAMILAHESNQSRCPGCGTSLNIEPDEIEGYEHHTRECLVCKQIDYYEKEREKAAKKRKRPVEKKPWIYRMIVPHLRALTDQED